MYSKSKDSNTFYYIKSDVEATATPTKYTIDLFEIGEKGRIEKDLLLRAGDVVWVPETWY